VIYDAVQGDARIGVTGMLKNESDGPLGRIHVEVQFMDAAGRLVDVIAGGTAVDRLEPGGQGAFRAWDHAYLPEELYASHAVFVRWAPRALGSG
jgi:hypothetical protein